MVDEYGKSDSSTIPGRLPNKARTQAQEAMEERGLAKGNPLKRDVSRKVAVSGEKSPPYEAPSINNPPPSAGRV